MSKKVLIEKIKFMGKINHGFKDLLAYKRAFELACKIFDITLAVALVNTFIKGYFKCLY